MSWTHYFDEDEAKKYGLHEAIVLNHIRQWIRKNEANKENFHEGRTWTYNSIRAWAILLPFLTAKQLRTAVDNLVKSGILLRGNFNKSQYDRTSWYSICPQEPIDLPKEANEIVPEGEPIPSSPPTSPPAPPQDSPAPTVPVVVDDVKYHEQLQERLAKAEEKEDGAGVLVYGLELMHGCPFANYPKEWKSAKRLVAAVHTMGRGNGNMIPALRDLLRAYQHKRRGARDSFWKDAPLTPSDVLCRLESLVSYIGKEQENQALDEMCRKALQS